MNQDPVSLACKLLGIDRATFLKMARQMDTPELREAFQKHLGDKDFDQTIAELQEQFQEVFNHVKKSPNVR